MFVGIDVAAASLNCVALDDRGAFAGGRVFRADELSAVAAWAAGASVIAIDAPAGLSTAPHASDESLAPKFRAGRCAEIALGREHGIWVPWVGPATAPETGWIATGLRLFAALGDLGAELIEVFPYAGFRVLAGETRLAKKTTVDGARQRTAALRAAGFDAADLELWSHDSVDATAAAVIAAHRGAGRALPVSCGHDDSAIWLPDTA